MNHAGAAPIRRMGPIRNPRWEHKRTECYVIVSSVCYLGVSILPLSSTIFRLDLGTGPTSDRIFFLVFSFYFHNALPS